MGILGKILSKDENKDGDKNTKPVLSDKAATKPKGEVVKPVSNKSAAKSVTSTPKEKKEAVAVSVDKKDDPSAYKYLIEPQITEKATDLMQLNKYSFIVPISANKAEVAKKIMNVYGVKPVKVNLIRKRGKKVRHGRKFGRTKDFKKAIITLNPSDKIEIYEGV
jgi:large subunit ribosomal protein L23